MIESSGDWQKYRAGIDDSVFPVFFEGIPAFLNEFDRERTDFGRFGSDFLGAGFFKVASLGLLKGFFETVFLKRLKIEQNVKVIIIILYIYDYNDEFFF